MRSKRGAMERGPARRARASWPVSALLGAAAVGGCEGDGGSGGDEPAYIQGMYDAFAANRDVLACEAYFDDNTAGDVCASPYMPDDAPRASALYQRLFGR